MTNFINFITVVRIFLAPIILIFLIFGNYLICLLLFFLAGLTDYFDGYLARKYNAESQLGEILDPIADKILIVFTLIGLSVYLDSFLIAFLGSLIILILYGFIIIFPLTFLKDINDLFLKVILYGLCSYFFFHFIINILMTMGLFPVIGIPMILFSYGGSSLICASFGFSVLALILKDYREYNRLGV